MTAPKRRWFRFSLRTLFVALTLVGIVVFAVGLWRRAEYRRERSQLHLTQAAMFQDVVSGLERLPARNAKQEDLLRQFRAKVNYHAALSSKFEDAARRPWAPVEEELPVGESTH